MSHKQKENLESRTIYSQMNAFAYVANDELYCAEVRYDEDTKKYIIEKSAKIHVTHDIPNNEIRFAKVEDIGVTDGGELKSNITIFGKGVTLKTREGEDIDLDMVMNFSKADHDNALLKALHILVKDCMAEEELEKAMGD